MSVIRRLRYIVDRKVAKWYSSFSSTFWPFSRTIFVNSVHHLATSILLLPRLVWTSNEFSTNCYDLLKRMSKTVNNQFWLKSCDLRVRLDARLMVVSKKFNCLAWFNCSMLFIQFIDRWRLQLIRNSGSVSPLHSWFDHNNWCHF